MEHGRARDGRQKYIEASSGGRYSLSGFNVVAIRALALMRGNSHRRTSGRTWLALKAGKAAWLGFLCIWWLLAFYIVLNVFGH